MQAWAREALNQSTAEQDLREFVEAGPTPEQEAELFGVGAMAEAIDGVAIAVEQVQVDDASEVGDDDDDAHGSDSEDD